MVAPGISVPAGTGVLINSSTWILQSPDRKQTIMELSANLIIVGGKVWTWGEGYSSSVYSIYFLFVQTHPVSAALWWQSSSSCNCVPFSMFSRISSQFFFLARSNKTEIFSWNILWWVIVAETFAYSLQTVQWRQSNNFMASSVVWWYLKYHVRY